MDNILFTWDIIYVIFVITLLPILRLCRGILIDMTIDEFEIDKKEITIAWTNGLSSPKNLQLPLLFLHLIGVTLALNIAVLLPFAWFGLFTPHSTEYALYIGDGHIYAMLLLSVTLGAILTVLDIVAVGKLGKKFVAFNLKTALSLYTKAPMFSTDIECDDITAREKGYLKAFKTLLPEDDLYKSVRAWRTYKQSNDIQEMLETPFDRKGWANTTLSKTLAGRFSALLTINRDVLHYWNKIFVHQRLKIPWGAVYTESDLTSSDEIFIAVYVGAQPKLIKFETACELVEKGDLSKYRFSSVDYLHSQPFFVPIYLTQNLNNYEPKASFSALCRLQPS